MKPTLLTLITLFSLQLGISQNSGEMDPARGVTLTVVLDNVLNDQGEILLGLHNSATFMKGAGIQNRKAEARKGSLSFSFENVPSGTYAISVLHDLNANGRMDYETNGMPGEPYGMSGNDMTMGPPTFDSAAFEVGSEDLELHIRF